MRFNFKFSNYKRLYNFFWFLSLLNIFFSTDILLAKTFSISDIEISTPFEINFNKNTIIDEGFSQAYDQLILSIVQTKDQKKIQNIPLSTIKGMIETFSINEEKFINEIYYLSLNVNFSKKKIFNLLEGKNIFASQPIKKDILFIPIIIDENKNEIQIFSENNLFKNWNLDKKKFHLLNYILPTQDIEDFNLIKNKLPDLENYDFMDIINKYNLENYIIMVIFKNNKQLRIFNKINLNGTVDIRNFKYKALELNFEDNEKKVIKNLKEVYENYWKFNNQINTSVKLPLTISVNNDINLNISQFEKTLSDIDSIYDFYIHKFDNKNNIYKMLAKCGTAVGIGVGLIINNTFVKLASSMLGMYLIHHDNITPKMEIIVMATAFFVYSKIGGIVFDILPIKKNMWTISISIYVETLIIYMMIVTVYILLIV